jgi:N-acetylglucosamine-6-phosphate deacetylase
MSRTAVLAGRILTPLEEITDAVLLIEDERIVSIGPREAVTIPAGAREVDARNLTVVPGFIDVHIHGAGSFDVMEATPQAMSTVAATVARFGTTSLVATTVTASADQTCRSVEGMARFFAHQRDEATRARPAAEYLGIHFEGPFLSHARKGVQPGEFIQAPSVDLLRRFLGAAEGHARLITLAPEVPGALELVDLAVQNGLAVGMGHSDATYEQSRAAIARGARHAIHVFNAMRPFSHRETGIIGAVLTEPAVTCEIIADGVHVDDAAIRILIAAKSARGTILISDGISATGMSDGKYRLGTFEVTVSGGVCRDARGNLAGSTLTLDRALRKMVSLGVPLRDAIQMLTVNPAQLLRMETKKGVLALGADADLVFLDEHLSVRNVILRGHPLS